MDSTELGVPATFFSPSPLSANRDPPAAPDSLKIQRAAHRQTAALEKDFYCLSAHCLWIAFTRMKQRIQYTSLLGAAGIMQEADHLAYPVREFRRGGRTSQFGRWVDSTWLLFVIVGVTHIWGIYGRRVLIVSLATLGS
jgi:hypothetical protein